MSTANLLFEPLDTTSFLKRMNLEIALVCYIQKIVMYSVKDFTVHS